MPVLSCITFICFWHPYASSSTFSKCTDSSSIWCHDFSSSRSFFNLPLSYSLMCLSSPFMSLALLSLDSSLALFALSPIKLPFNSRPSFTSELSFSYAPSFFFISSMLYFPMWCCYLLFICYFVLLFICFIILFFACIL